MDDSEEVQGLSAGSYLKGVCSLHRVDSDTRMENMEKCTLKAEQIYILCGHDGEKCSIIRWSDFWGEMKTKVIVS